MSFTDELNALKRLVQPQQNPLEKKAAEVTDRIIAMIKQKARECPANRKLECFFTVYCNSMREETCSGTRESFFRNAKQTIACRPSPMMEPFRSLLVQKLSHFGVEIGNYVVEDSKYSFADDENRVEMPVRDYIIGGSAILKIDPKASYTVYRTQYGLSYQTEYVMYGGQKMTGVKTETSLVLYVHYKEK